MSADTTVAVPGRYADNVVGGSFLESLDIPAAMTRLRGTDLAPGMLSLAERAMLFQVTAHWRGDGAVVDGGSFLGASLTTEAQGLLAGNGGDLARDRFPGGKPIHGYELGYLPAPESDSTDPRRVFGDVEYVMGESFVPILEQAVAPYRDLIDLHIGDLIDQTWDGSPVEVAFIDVCKTAALNAHVSEQFYPALIEGGSVLVHQDFFFDRLPWIKVTMGHLRDYFSWEGQVFTSSVYRNVKAVPADVAAYDPFRDGTLEECLRLHDAVEFPGVGRQAEFRLALSRAYLTAMKGHRDDALDRLRVIGEEYADLVDSDPQPRGSGFRLTRAVRQVTAGRV